MKKFIAAFLVLAFTGLCGLNARASSYTVDDNQIDQMLNSAPLTVNTVFADLSSVAGSSFASATVSSKDPIVAIVLDFFLGGFGIHRFYLGTEVLTGVGYILTCGGIFGIVPLVDFVVLIINYKDISPYINNPKFFMWA